MPARFVHRLVVLGTGSLLGGCASPCACPCPLTAPCEAPCPSPSPTPSSDPGASPGGVAFADPTPVARSPAPAFDRELARRAVLVAVLEALHRRKDTRRFVLDPMLAPDRLDLAWDAELEKSFSPGGWMTLPDGRRMLRPGLKNLDAGLLADWAAHTKPTPTPRDGVASLPIEWFTEADWKALRSEPAPAKGDDLEDRWGAFHRLHPQSSGWITLSDVGFSADGTQALVQTSSLSGGLDGSGHWVLLRRVDGVWTVAEAYESWVS